MIDSASLEVPADPRWSHVVGTFVGSLLADVEDARRGDIEMTIRQLTEDMFPLPDVDQLRIHLETMPDGHVMVDVAAQGPGLDAEVAGDQIRRTIGWKVADLLLDSVSTSADAQGFSVRGRARR